MEGLRKEEPLVLIDCAALSLESMYLYSVRVYVSFRVKWGGKLVMRVLLERTPSSTSARPPLKTIGDV